MNKQTSSFISICVEKLQQIKKTDWLALALAGAILLILALPDGTDTGNGLLGSSGTSITGSVSTAGGVSTAGNASAAGVGTQNGASGTNDVSMQVQSQNTSEAGSNADSYVAKLEEKLKDVLEQMDGVGKVAVMITISDYGESIVEKDVTERSSSTSEVENGNVEKSSVEQEWNEQTVHVENESGTYPYIEKEILPTIEGIVVVAEGGGNATVVSNISKAAMALFPVEAHKIIVVKMSDKGD